MSLEAVVSSLARSFQTGVPGFVLIDPMLGEPIPVEAVDVGNVGALNAAREQAWGRAVHAVALAPGITLPPTLHPYLVELQGSSDSWIASTAEMAWAELIESRSDGLASSGAAAHRIGGWLQSSMSPHELTGALSAMLRVSTNAATTARYQRLADRRVLSWLCQVVGDDRVAAQLGRVHSWRYLDACGQLVQLRSPAEVAVPLRLSQAEWRSFMQGELLHRTVARWLGERAQLPRDDRTPNDARACYARARSALERAEAAARGWPQRFTKPADRAGWAALTILHPGIETDPNVLSVLNAPPEAGEPIETLDTLSPQLSALRLKGTA